MPYKLTALFVLLISLASFNSYAEIPEETICTEQKLLLNGSGTRTKFFIKLYVAALYTQTKINDAQNLLEMSQPLCMRLHITSSKITAKKMVAATKEGFEKATQGDTTSIENEISTFLGWLSQPIKKGDVFEFSFSPVEKVTVSKNKARLGEIDNPSFATALFAIWLGNNPAQLSLKEKLLGN